MNCSIPGLPVHDQLPESTQTHVHFVGDAIQPFHPRSSPSPPAPNLSQHEGLFKWVSSSHKVAKVLEFQLQHQSFQWTPRTDLLKDGLVGSPCSPRDSQESSPTPQFKRINSSALSFLYNSTLTSIESVIPSSHLILSHPLVLLPPIPPSIRVFSNESALRIRWPKYWSFSFGPVQLSVCATPSLSQTENILGAETVSEPLHFQSFPCVLFGTPPCI